jgi:hypothetical protein
MADWLSALNCPYCGARLQYARSDERTHLFQCWGCGPLILPPDGRLRRLATEAVYDSLRVGRPIVRGLGASDGGSEPAI